MFTSTETSYVHTGSQNEVTADIFVRLYFYFTNSILLSSSLLIKDISQTIIFIINCYSP